MDDNVELRRLVRKSIEIGESNNKMLQGMIKAGRWARIFKTVYWVVIIGTMLGAYYYIQPLIDSLLGVYGGLISGIDGLKNTGEVVNPANLELLETIKNFLPK